MGQSASTIVPMGRAATEHFSAQLPHAHWIGPEQRSGSVLHQKMLIFDFNGFHYWQQLF